MTATKVFGRTDFVPTKKKGKWYFVSEKRGSLLSSVEYVATDFVVLYVCCYTLHFPSLLFIFVHARFYFWKARAKFDRVCWQKHENTYGTVTLLSCVFVYVRLFDGDTVTKKINKKSTRADVVVWFVRPQICTKKKGLLILFTLLDPDSCFSSFLSVLKFFFIGLVFPFFPSLRCSCRLLFSILVSGNLAFVALDPWRRCLLLFSSYHHRGWCNFYLLNEFDTRNVKVVRGEWMALLFFRSLSLSFSLISFTGEQLGWFRERIGEEEKRDERVRNETSKRERPAAFKRSSQDSSRTWSGEGHRAWTSKTAPTSFVRSFSPERTNRGREGGRPSRQTTRTKYKKEKKKLPRLSLSLSEGERERARPGCVDELSLNMFRP